MRIAIVMLKWGEYPRNPRAENQLALAASHAAGGSVAVREGIGAGESFRIAFCLVSAEGGRADD